MTYRFQPSLAGNGIMLLTAGHETTASMISLGTIALLDHPDDFARLDGTNDPAVQNTKEIYGTEELPVAW